MTMTMTTARWTRACAMVLATLVMSLGLGHQVHAQATDADRKQAFEAASQVAVKGPHDVKLASQATLHLPLGKVFVPQPEAGRLMVAMGNPGDHKALQGLVFPEGDAQWFATVHYDASGYIKDDDAREWNADELLKSYREGTEAANEERVKMGVPQMEIIGWAEKPHYAADTHRLVWAMSSRDKGAPAGEPQGVNYNTYALGREGYVSLNLVTGLAELPQYKGEAQALLGALEFDQGKRYQDFNASTDHVAEYGLAALVLGAGAKKLGLFAVIFAFLAKFAKVFIVAGLAFGGGLMKLFSRKKGGG